jgi:hypothetical protein
MSSASAGYLAIGSKFRFGMVLASAIAFRLFLWLVPFSLVLAGALAGLVRRLPGCLIIGFGVALLHAASRIYLPGRLENSSKLYGSLGTATVILAWLLLVGQVIVGATIVNAMRVQRTNHPELGSRVRAVSLTRGRAWQRLRAQGRRKARRRHR